jgi:hypothetical protein
MSIVLTVALTASCCSHTLSSEQLAFLTEWLNRHPSWTLATDADSSCPENITSIRKGQNFETWPAIADFHPYQVVGDLNGDDHVDFAVVLKNQTEFALAVFNGPVTAGEDAAFREPIKNMTCAGLFFGPPRSKPHRLVVGPFESEGRVLIPAGTGYKWGEASDDN